MNPHQTSVGRVEEISMMSFRAGQDRASEPLVETEFGVADLPTLRRAVKSSAKRVGLTESKAGDLALAVNEIATNAIVHGGPPATLRIWGRGREIVCEVADAGPGIHDALAGRQRPAVDSSAGRGLWLARHLCDAVKIGNGSGCTVTLHASAPLPAVVPI
jgi:serine/threonine-protein kinase RsbW